MQLHLLSRCFTLPQHIGQAYKLILISVKIPKEGHIPHKVAILFGNSRQHFYLLRN